MPLTVRLDGTLEAALARYCADTGVSKSLVVQESLASYLLDQPPRATRRHAETSPAASPPASANYQAFAAAGLVGGVALGQGADKAAVRARIATHFSAAHFSAAHFAQSPARDAVAAAPKAPAGKSAKARRAAGAHPDRP